MAQVTQPGLYHTAGGEHLEGIDFAGKTGTAQVMSHQALDKTGKGQGHSSKRVVRRHYPPPQSRSGGRRALAEWRQELVFGPHRRQSRRGLRGEAAPPGEQPAAAKSRSACQAGRSWRGLDHARRASKMPGSQTARIHCRSILRESRQRRSTETRASPLTTASQLGLALPTRRINQP